MTTISDERLAEMHLRVAKIVRRYADDVPPVKQFLHDGEDRLLVDYVSALRAQGGVRVKGALSQLSAIEHAIATAQDGLHDSQHWSDTWTAEYANGHESYQAWINAEFSELRRILSALEASPAPVSEEWLRDTAMNVMLATEVEEATRILRAALAAKGGQ